MARNGKEIDVSIGGYGFRLATDQELNHITETIPVRKEQMDTEAEPGEQSLSGWWRRSQESWHEGAGNLFQEGRGDVVSHQGFYDSQGVDVWTKNKVSLLRRMVENTAASTGWVRCGTYRTTGLSRRNLCIMPNFEYTSIFSWVVANKSAADTYTITKDTGTFYSGAASMKVVLSAYDGAATRENHDFVKVPFASNLIPGVRYAFSLRFKMITSGSMGGAGVEVYLNGATFVAGQWGIPFDEWRYISGSFVYSATTDELGIYIYPDSATLPLTVYIDEVLIEEGSFAGPYFDGNTSGASWEGSANYSVSVANATTPVDKVWAINGTDLYTGSDPTAALTSAYTGLSTNPPTDAVVVGDSFYMVGNRTLYAGTLSHPTSAQSFNLRERASRIAFGKHRLWVCGGRRIWQPAPNGGDGGFADVPIYIHPTLNWTYTCVAEGPQAMYFGGHDGLTSSIQAITLNADGSIPTLSGATITATLPSGELVQEIATLAGQYIGIGTNRGFRVGIFDGTSIVYGPLTVAPTGVQNCTALLAYDTYFLVAFEVTGGRAEAYRVDVSSELGDLVFPYARDIEASSSGYIRSLAQFTGNRVLAVGSDTKLYAQHATELVSSGFLRTGRIRFRMSDPKLFKYLDLDTDPLNGTIGIDGYETDDTTFSVGTFSTAGLAGVSGLALPSNLGPQRHVSLKFTLNRHVSDATKGPVLRSYLLKALPSVKPQRLITLPLLCFDQETARSGQRYGKAGDAVSRFQSLQALEDVGDTVTLTQFNSLTETTKTVVIEGLRFVETAVPPPGCSGRGGIILAQLRTAEA